MQRISQAIEEQMGVIEGFFGEKTEYSFMELAKTLTHKVIVVLTFLALLELMRSNKVTVTQDGFAGEIIIRKKTHEK